MAKETKDNFTAPKVGDTVNHVSTTGSITEAKVKSIHPKHGGRLVTLEIPGKKDVEVSYRPVEKAAGNTWHFALLALCLWLASMAFASAAIPQFSTYSAAGNSSGTATALIPCGSHSQARVVTVNYVSDTSGASLLLSSGTTAYSSIWTNTATSAVTNTIDSTNGLTVGGTLVLQHNGVLIAETIQSYGNTGNASWTNANSYVYTNPVTSYGIYGQGPAGTPGTNVSWVATSAAYGVIPNIGDSYYIMGSATSIPIGATTGWLDGEDVYSGNFGRPLEVSISSVTTTNRLPVISVHYDALDTPY